MRAPKAVDTYMKNSFGKFSMGHSNEAEKTRYTARKLAGLNDVQVASERRDEKWVALLGILRDAREADAEQQTRDRWQFGLKRTRVQHR